MFLLLNYKLFERTILLQLVSSYFLLLQHLVHLDLVVHLDLLFPVHVIFYDFTVVLPFHLEGLQFLNLFILDLVVQKSLKILLLLSRCPLLVQLIPLLFELIELLQFFPLLVQTDAFDRNFGLIFLGWGRHEEVLSFWSIKFGLVG
jgi:hypothetical protein